MPSSAFFCATQHAHLFLQYFNTRHVSNLKQNIKQKWNETPEDRSDRLLCFSSLPDPVGRSEAVPAIWDPKFRGPKSCLKSNKARKHHSLIRKISKKNWTSIVKLPVICDPHCSSLFGKNQLFLVTCEESSAAPPTNGWGLMLLRCEWKLSSEVSRNAHAPLQGICWQPVYKTSHSSMFWRQKVMFCSENAACSFSLLLLDCHY